MRYVVYIHVLYKNDIMVQLTLNFKWYEKAIVLILFIYIYFYKNYD